MRYTLEARVFILPTYYERCKRLRDGLALRTALKRYLSDDVANHALCLRRHLQKASATEVLTQHTDRLRVAMETRVKVYVYTRASTRERSTQYVYKNVHQISYLAFCKNKEAIDHALGIMKGVTVEEKVKNWGKWWLSWRTERGREGWVGSS